MLSSETKKWFSKHSFVLITCTVIFFALTVVWISPTFQQCVSVNDQYRPHNSLQENAWTLIRALWWCGGIFAEENGEAITGLASAFIGIFTLTLWRSASEQGRLTQESIVLSTKAADAAVAAERARFHIIIDSHNLGNFIRLAGLYDNSPGMPVSGEIRVTYHFKNYGKCPGRITEISHGIRLSETPPDDVSYTVVSQAPKEYMVPSLGETETQVYESSQHFESMQDAIAIRTGRTKVWFFGRLDYVDFVTNKPQVHRFLLRYIQTEGGEWRFQSFDHKHYNQST
jgi:hypothetical protein